MTENPAPRYPLIRDLEQVQAARLAAERAAHPTPCRLPEAAVQRKHARALLDGLLTIWPVSSGDEGHGEPTPA